MTISLHPPRNVVRRNLLATYIAAFCASLGFSLVTPLLPLFMLELLEGDIGRVGFWVGAAVGISPLMTALTGPWWGSLGQRIGQKKMIQRALLAIGVCIALMAVVGQPWQIVLLRGLIGSLGGISVACLAAVTATSSRQELGRNIGVLQGAQISGQVVGPLAGGGLAMLAGMRPSFVISSALFAAALALVTWLYLDVHKPAARTRETPTAESGAGPRLAGSLRFWATLGVLFCANFIDGSFLVTLPLYLPLLGAPHESLTLLAGLGLGGGALAMAVAAMLAGRLSERYSSGTLFLVMLSGAGLALIGVILAVSWWQLVALRVLLGLLAGGLPTLAYAAAASLVPPSRRGAVVGLASSAGLLGWAVAPVVVGFLVGVRPQAVYALDLLLVAFCGLALGWSHGTARWRSLSGAARSRLASLTR